jgi:rhodanese-related sulfurtransferase
MTDLNSELIFNHRVLHADMVPLAWVAILGLAATVGAFGGTTDSAKSSPPRPDLPQAKQTTLGLYVTAKQAYEQWKANPETVLIIDVRTPEEYLFVGHPAMAWKIPVSAQSYEWDAAKGHYPMKMLPDFAARVATVAKPDDTLLVICRSGSRSAAAVNLLAQAGFKHVYNIVDGMEGDANGDSDTVAKAQGRADGWKNSGCPWTKKLTPERLVLPAAP